MKAVCVSTLFDSTRFQVFYVPFSYKRLLQINLQLSVLMIINDCILFTIFHVAGIPDNLIVLRLHIYPTPFKKLLNVPFKVLVLSFRSAFLYNDWYLLLCSWSWHTPPDYRSTITVTIILRAMTCLSFQQFISRLISKDGLIYPYMQMYSLMSS